MIESDIDEILSCYPEHSSKNYTAPEFTELCDLVLISLECLYTKEQFETNMVIDYLKTKVCFEPEPQSDYVSMSEPQCEPEPQSDCVSMSEHQPEPQCDCVSEPRVEVEAAGGLSAEQQKIAELQQRSMSSQRTTDWLAKRNNYITGSIIAHALNLMGQAARNNLLLEKASNGGYRSFGGSFHTHYGNRYEPVTNMIYCYRNKTKIHDFGLIQHKDVDFLAASTDGVTDQLRNIEIKSLSSRKINGKVKKEYYHQMQLQMECLGLEVTDFIECRFTEYPNFQKFKENSFENKEKGCMIEVFDLESGDLDYVYSPIEIHNDFDALNNWIQTEEHRISESTTQIFVRNILWQLVQYSCMEVKKDPHWFNDYFPEMQRFWKDVADLRQNPTKLEQALSVKKQPKHLRDICQQMNDQCML